MLERQWSTASPRSPPVVLVLASRDIRSWMSVTSCWKYRWNFSGGVRFFAGRWFCSGSEGVGSDIVVVVWEGEAEE